MMRNLEIERVALAAMSVGLAKRCVDRMAKYFRRAYVRRPVAAAPRLPRG